MFTHHKLKVYGKAVAYAATARRMVCLWGRRHAIADHLRRASESVVLNIAEGARLFSGPAKVGTLDYSIGSTLECAACLDIAVIKGLLSFRDAFGEKRHLLQITKMLNGLRKSWLNNSMQEEPSDYRIDYEEAASVPLFHHESLDVYQAGLDFVRWLVALPQGQDLTDRLYREVDKAATSVVLNIAEGNGRYSELDHRRFLDMAAASAVKAAAYLDLCREKGSASLMDISAGTQLLGRICAMLSGF